MTQLAFIDAATGLPVLVKQPVETRLFRIDFANKLRHSALSSATSVSATGQGVVAGSAAVSVSAITISAGRYVLFTLAGGTDDENYKITALVLTDDGQSLEGDGMLYCREY